MKLRKKFLSIVTVCALCISSTASVFAADNTKSMDAIVQNVLDENDVDATVTQMEGEDYASTWNNYFDNQQGVVGLENKLSAEGFTASDELKNMAVKITNNGNNYMCYYYYYKFYENAVGEKVATMYTHSPNTRDLYSIYAEKINANNECTEYYNYVDGHMPEAVTYDTVSFLCGLGGTLACGSFSAMLFAFVPASIAVGMACGAAFDWVCSR